MDGSSAAIVIAILVQTIVMIVFLLLSTKKIETQTNKLTDNFNRLVNIVTKLEVNQEHHDKRIKCTEDQMRENQKGSQRFPSRE